jgi:hypothetical protein
MHVSILDQLGSAGPAERALAVVVDFVVSVEKHVSKTTGKTSYGFKVAPKLADGTVGRFGDMWIRLDSPDALRAFVAALPRIAKVAGALDAKMVEAKEWAAPPKPAASKSTPKAETPTQAAPVEEKRSALDDILGDLPA